MEPLYLHYSRAKLIRLAVYGLLGTAMMLWVATGGIDDPEGGGRRGAWLGRMLGGEGLLWLGWIFAAILACLTLLYLRRAFADPVAARADADGVTINTLFGSHSYARGDIERIELRRPAGQPILQVLPVAGRGKKRGLTVNGLAEDCDEVEAWLQSVGSAWAER
jgi:hypothetical protein